MRKFLTILGIFFIQFANFVFADESLKLEGLKTQHEPSTFHAIFSLIVVLGLIYLVSFLYQKLNVLNEKITNKKDGAEINKFKIITTTPMGQGKFLHIVEINNKYLALGSTQNNISFLKEFSKEEVENINEKS